MNIFLYRYKFFIGATILLALVVVVIVCVYKFGSKDFFHKSKRPQLTIPTKDIRKVVLENGMTILVFPLKTVPKVLVQIAYDIGSGVEESGERGMAHLVEHMIFKGTERMAEGDLDEIACKYGATHNAETSQDITTYYFETNKNNWRPFFEILSDCMQHVRFDEQHLASEMKAVIQELKMYKDDYWYLMLEKIDALLYPANHPYHHPIIGYKEDLMQLTADNLRSFYKKYYQPDRATLFVIGDVEVDEVLHEAKKQFGAIPLEKSTKLPVYPALTLDLTTNNTTFYEDVKAEQLSFYWRIPGMKDQHEIVSTAAAFLLGAGEGSRLHRVLVDEQQIAVSVAVQAEKNLESGAFLILIEPVAGKIQDCRALVERELKNAIDHGFSERELEHMIKMQGKHFLQRLQNFDSLAQEWIVTYFATGDEYQLFNRVNRFADITSTQVQAFIAEHLDPFFMNQMQVLPVPESKQHLVDEAQIRNEAFDETILAKFVRTAPLEKPRYVHEMKQPEPLDFTFPKPDRVVKLTNGLTVLLKENRSLPLLSVQIKFKDYFFLQSAKEGVLTDVMMRALIEGSQGLTKKELVDFFEFHGVDYYFGPSGARLSMLNADVPLILKRFVQVLTKPTFAPNVLDKLKMMAIDSFERDKDDAIEIAHRELKKLAYAGHPFSWDFDDAISFLKTATVDDIWKQHTALVSPANMILSVVGDFDVDGMEKLVREIFGALSGAPAQQRTILPSAFKGGEQRAIYLSRDQMVLLFGRQSALTITHPDLIPVKLLNFIMFNDAGCSRLFQLRERTGLFYTAFGGWGVGAGVEPGIDFIGALLNPKNAGFAEQEMRSMVDHLATEGVNAQEIDAARHLYVKSLIDAISTNSGVADLLCTLEVFNLGFDYYDKVLTSMQKLTSDEMNQLCKKYFSMHDMVSIKVGAVR